jgi:hypothetical protein
MEKQCFRVDRGVQKLASTFPSHLHTFASIGSWWHSQPLAHSASSLNSCAHHSTKSARNSKSGQATALLTSLRVVVSRAAFTKSSLPKCSFR